MRHSTPQKRLKRLRIAPQTPQTTRSGTSTSDARILHARASGSPSAGGVPAPHPISRRQARSARARASDVRQGPEPQAEAESLLAQGAYSFTSEPRIGYGDSAIGRKRIAPRPDGARLPAKARRKCYYGPCRDSLPRLTRDPSPEATQIAVLAPGGFSHDRETAGAAGRCRAAFRGIPLASSVTPGFRPWRAAQADSPPSTPQNAGHAAPVAYPCPPGMHTMGGRAVGRPWTPAGRRALCQRNTATGRRKPASESRHGATPSWVCMSPSLVRALKDSTGRCGLHNEVTRTSLAPMSVLHVHRLADGLRFAAYL